MVVVWWEVREIELDNYENNLYKASCDIKLKVENRDGQFVNHILEPSFIWVIFILIYFLRLSPLSH